MSKRFDIDFPEDDWNRIIQAGKDAVKRVGELFVADFWGNLREEAPVDHGRLAGSFQLSGTSPTWHIVSGVAYAMAVWKGTPAHTIVPVNKKALFWPGANHPVKRVNHPGTKPNDFVERAFTRSENRRDDFVAMALQEFGLS